MLSSLRQRGADDWVRREDWRAKYAKGPTSRSHPKAQSLEQGAYHWPEAAAASQTGMGYGRIVRDWVTAIGLEPSGYGTHSLRRTKAAEIYRKTGNLRAVQLLLGHTKVDSTVRYLGVELEDALSIAERIDI